MKGSFEAKSIKLVDIDSLKINVQLGWIFTTTLVAAALILAVARASFTYEVQNQYDTHCAEIVQLDAQVAKQFDTPVTNGMMDMCKLLKKSDLSVMSDIEAWSYGDVYKD